MADYITGIIERYEEDLNKVKQSGGEHCGFALDLVKEQTPDFVW